MLDFCLLIWHHECLWSSVAWFEAETEKRAVFEDLSVSEGADTAEGTIHLQRICREDMCWSTSKPLHTNVCSSTSWVIAHPGRFTLEQSSLHSYHWSHWTTWLLDPRFDPEAFDKRQFSSQYPSTNSDWLRQLEDSSYWELLHCKPLSTQKHTKIQTVGEIRCGLCLIQALRPRYALC